MKDWQKTQGYDETKSISVPAGGALTLILGGKVPSGTGLRITHLGNDAGDIGAWTDNGGVTWTLKINGVPHSLMNDEGNQLGTTNDPRELGEPIELRGGDVYEVYGKNPSAATAYLMLVSLKGEYGYKRR